MRRLSSLLTVGMMICVLGVAPAVADVDSNPNVIEFGPAQCADGQHFEVVWTPTDPAAVGLAADSNIVGVGTAIWLADAAGNKLALLTRPIPAGLADLTVFCWWPAPTPTGFVGADILFSGHARP